MINGATPFADAYTMRAERQGVTYRFALATYGEATRGRRYQAFRFGEEALELVQTQGVTREEMHRLVDRTYDRAVGSFRDEVGDVSVCLDIMCENLGLQREELERAGAERFLALDPEKTRAKDAQKIAEGFI